jgi:4-oxalocrotonate tautomerase
MPMVRIELYPGRTPEQKTACARAIMEVMKQHLNAAPEATQVIFVDVEKSDWLDGAKMGPGVAKTG